MQDPTEKHFGDVGILDKYEVNNKLGAILTWAVLTGKRLRDPKYHPKSRGQAMTYGIGHYSNLIYHDY